MNSLKKKIALFALMMAVVAAAGAQSNHTASPALTPVIFETDLGNDVDDAMALAMLNHYQDSGLIKLVAVSTNKNSPYSARCIDIINTFYGHPHVPVGEVKGGTNSEGDSKNYAQSVCEFKPPFDRSKSDSFPESVALYRRVLAQQPDHSVIIVSVGFSTNLAKLLATGGDEYSPLSGKDLIAKKVKLLSMMAGNFEGDRIVEYNVLRDISAAKKVFEEFPCPVVTSPFELGNKILYPASSITNDLKWATANPVVVAYESYLPMPYDRPTWDLTAVLYAVEGVKNYFTLSKSGDITVDEKGYTSFKENPSGNRQYLEVNKEQGETIRNHFLQMVPQKPKSYQ